MKVLTNGTSPFARIARIGLMEKGYDLSDTQLVNPWADDPDLMAANTAARVPTVVLDDGHPLSESLLIVMWLERTRPEPSLLGDDPSRVLSQAGRAMGVIEAATAIVIGKLHVDEGFEEGPVGLRRRRSIVLGLEAAEQDIPPYARGVPDLAVISTVVALDYVKMRFPAASWTPPTPGLDGLSAALANRPAFQATAPRA